MRIGSRKTACRTCFCSLLLSTLLFAQGDGQAAESAATKAGQDRLVSLREDAAETTGMLADKLSPAERRVYDKLKVLIGIAQPGQTGCEHSLSSASTVMSSGGAVIWICEQQLLYATQFALASSLILLASSLENKKQLPINEFDLLTDYYANAHVLSHSRRMLGQFGEVLCSGSMAAYLLAHQRQLSECFSTEAATVLSWIGGFRRTLAKLNPELLTMSDADYLDSAAGRIYSAILAFVIAHELGHVIHPPARVTEQSRTNLERATAIEEAADAFGLKLLIAHGDEFVELSGALAPLFAMLYRARHHKSVSGPTPAVLEARLLAGTRLAFCGGMKWDAIDSLKTVSESIASPLQRAFSHKFCDSLVRKGQ